MKIMALNRFKALIWGLVILLLVFFLFFPVNALIAGNSEGQPVLVMLLFKEKEFAYEYVHSVQKTPVRENFVIKADNGLLLKSTDYQSLGVGLPFLPEEGRLVNDNGVFRLTLNRPYENITLGFMPLAQQSLLFNNKHYYLSDYLKPGELLKIEVKKMSLAKIIWRTWQAGGKVYSG